MVRSSDRISQKRAREEATVQQEVQPRERNQLAPKKRATTKPNSARAKPAPATRRRTDAASDTAHNHLPSGPPAQGTTPSHFVTPHAPQDPRVPYDPNVQTTGPAFVYDPPNASVQFPNVHTTSITPTHVHPVQIASNHPAPVHSFHPFNVHDPPMRPVHNHPNFSFHPANQPPPMPPTMNPPVQMFHAQQPSQANHRTFVGHPPMAPVNVLPPIGAPHVPTSMIDPHAHVHQPRLSQPPPYAAHRSRVVEHVPPRTDAPGHITRQPRTAEEHVPPFVNDPQVTCSPHRNEVVDIESDAEVSNSDGDQEHISSATHASGMKLSPQTDVLQEHWEKNGPPCLPDDDAPEESSLDSTKKREPIPQALRSYIQLPNFALFYIIGMRSVLSYLLLTSAFPQPKELDREARECFAEALKAVSLRHGEKPFDYNKVHSLSQTIVEQFIKQVPTYRRKARDFARSVVKDHIENEVRLAPPSILKDTETGKEYQNRRERSAIVSTFVAQMTDNERFLHGWTPGSPVTDRIPNDQLFASPILKEVILYFYQTSFWQEAMADSPDKVVVDRYIRHPDEFSPHWSTRVPPELVSFAATLIHSCFEEHETGTHKPEQFGTARHAKIYDYYLTTFNLLWLKGNLQGDMFRVTLRRMARAGLGLT